MTALWWAAWAVLAILVAILVAGVGVEGALVAVLAWSGGWVSSELSTRHRRPRP